MRQMTMVFYILRTPTSFLLVIVMLIGLEMLKIEKAPQVDASF